VGRPDRGNTASTMLPFVFPQTDTLSCHRYQALRLCPSKWSKSEPELHNLSDRSTNSTGWSCSTHLFASVGCSWEKVQQEPDSTIRELKGAGLWHLSTCVNDEHCDLQQVVPKSWISRPPDLKPYGDVCGVNSSS